MKHTWRWFGPLDSILIEEIEQVGSSGVVSALHHVGGVAVWTSKDIQLRQSEIPTRSDVSPNETVNARG